MKLQMKCLLRAYNCFIECNQQNVHLKSRNQIQQKNDARELFLQLLYQVFKEG